MQEQKFADRGDYVKYSILRHLLQEKLSCTVCWMMTPDTDTGRRYTKTSYLDSPSIFKNDDPAVFDYLDKQEKSGNPNIRSICGRISPIADCLFYWKRFPPSSTGRMNEHFTFRKSYFDGCLHRAIGTDFAFLDPDTGPENDSLKLKDLDKYVLWDEISRIYYSGHSVMVFNSLIRDANKRPAQVMQRTNLLRDILPTADVAALQADNIAFYFAVHERHSSQVERARAAIIKSWKRPPVGMVKYH